MSKNNIIVALALVLATITLSSAVLAQSSETALRATVSYNADGSATLDDIGVTIAGIDQQTDRPLSNRVELVLDSKVVYSLPAPVTFHLLDAFSPLPSYSITMRLPYFGNRGLLRIIRNNQSVLEFDLKRLCDNNGICGNYENGISCPNDCEIGHADIICLPYQDSICDPDCAGIIDPDCKEGNTQPTPPVPPTPPLAPVTTPAQPPADLPVYLFLVLIVALAIIYLWSNKAR